ncbi:hypothetical protein EDC04DRAFT_2795774, partial [Pisolithus marmoratus]
RRYRRVERTHWFNKLIRPPSLTDLEVVLISFRLRTLGYGASTSCLGPTPGDGTYLQAYRSMTGYKSIEDGLEHAQEYLGGVKPNSELLYQFPVWNSRNSYDGPFPPRRNHRQPRLSGRKSDGDGRKWDASSILLEPPFTLSRDAVEQEPIALVEVMCTTPSRMPQ